MGLTLRDIHSKDVIQLKTGENLGRIDDFIFDEATAQVESVILRGRTRLFGLFGRDEDLIIPWSGLKSIGTDVIMVDADVPASAPRRYRNWFF